MTMILRSYKGIYPKIGKDTYIDTTSVIIGDVTLGVDVSIWPLVVARGDVNYITIGDRTNIQDASVLHVTHPLVIGNDVTVGHKVMLHGCTIGNKVLLGMGAIILDDAIIDDEVMVGAGSLVPPRKHLISGFLYVGSPVKQIRALTDDERAFFQRSADTYVNIKNNYIKEAKQ